MKYTIRIERYAETKSVVSVKNNDFFVFLNINSDKKITRNIKSKW